MNTRFLSTAIAVAAAVAFPSHSPLFAADTPPDSHFVAHEWGTFTSVQGVDGVQVPWFGPISIDLPSFVHREDRRLKSSIVSRQRMETPVIYFYSDRERTVDVSVFFPKGEITEWFPLKSAALPRLPLRSDRMVLRWPQVHISPRLQLNLQTDGSGSHYYSARETDAALLVAASKTDDKSSATEKFLFYRGNADITAPLIVKPEPQDPDTVHLHNASSEELRHFFICDLDGRGGGTWLGFKSLKPGEERTVRLDAAADARSITEADLTLDNTSLTDPQRLGSQLVRALVGEGLFEKEATAMVNTWKSSWFSEKGTRVLYTLPRAWTDRTLPLKITPTPGEVARVMVARAEVITPARETALRALVEKYVAAPEADRPAILAETRALGLGRFAMAALQGSFARKTASPELQTAAWPFIQLVAAPVPPTATAAN